MSSHQRALFPAERRYLLDAARGLTARQSAHLRGVGIQAVQSGRKRGVAALAARSITHAVAMCLALGEFTGDDVWKADS